MVQVKKIFKVFKRTGRQQVQLAAYMFRQVAETWWQTIEPAYNYMADDIAWTNFKTAFHRKFILDHIWTHKLTEFE